MKEDFLHYVWQNKKFDFANLNTVQGEPLTIIQIGNYTKQSGPDFFSSIIVLNNQKWAGNIEIHLKSSDWYLHKHEQNVNYSNVILHVVWEYDLPVFQMENQEIPVLELKNYVSSDLINNYQKLKAKKSWINCENSLSEIPQFIWNNWKERLYLERLEQKSIPILELLHQNGNDWEATLFCFLAKSFGLNVNGEAFFQLALNMPFSIIRKESFDVNYLEALLYGQANLIPNNPQDSYSKDLKALYDYLVLKYQLQRKIVQPFEFYKLRPDNFPTVRLAQLSMLYATQRNLFSKIIESTTVLEIYNLFDVSVSSYWENHYNFEKSSVRKLKSLSKSFIDLLIINTILPVKFAYAKSLGKELEDEFVYFLEEISAEKNSITEKFAVFRKKPQNAFESQSLLQLKNEYCNKNKCLSCMVGVELLKS